MNESQESGDGAPNRQRELIEAAVRQAEEARRRANATASTPPSDPTLATLAPDSIPGYRIVRELHRGGQGVVYEAFQESTRRKVAIKVMKEGPLAGAADEARFDREVQVLGQLNHPNIVTIHDSGSAAGHHYFVMDYVPGQSLDAYMASARPSIDESMRLFASVCDAVNAAHLRGVIHRDLKPGNVRIDTEGEPRVLDFGLAKVATSDSDVSAMTITGQFVGSLPWASPEQAEAVPSKIDVRTDVYSLGVILYHMLTGRFPYNVVGNMRDVIDNILTAEPTRPSTIRKQINDEVETIVLKCLHKERDRRYQTAGELARDVKHYLSGEPIEAKRDSLPYVLRKRLKRHKVAVGFAAGFLTVVTAGFVTSITFWRQAVDERDASELARTAEEEQRKIAEEVNRFLNEDLLAAVAPSVEEGRGKDVTMREVLDVAAERIEGRFADEPLVEAAIRHTLGETYRLLGLHAEAERHLLRAVELRERVLGDEHQDTLDSVSGLTNLYLDQGRYAEAHARLTEIVEIMKRTYGDENSNTLAAIGNLIMAMALQGRYAEAEPLLAQLLEIKRRVSGVENVGTLTAMNNLAGLYLVQGRDAEAKQLFTEAFSISKRVRGAEHPETLKIMGNLAHVESELGQLEQAESLDEELLAICERVLGDEHPDTLLAMSNLAAVYKDQGRYALAEPLYAEAFAGQKRVLGEEHPNTLHTMVGLASLFKHQRRYEEAESLHKEALTLCRRVLGPDDRLTLTTMDALARLYMDQARYELAEPLVAEVLAARKRLLGPEHPDTQSSMHALGVLYLSQRRHEEAAAVLAELLPIRHRTLGAEHPDTLITMNCLAEAQRNLGHLEEAEALFAELLPIQRRILGDEHPDTLTSMNNQANVYNYQERYELAEPLYVKVLEVRRRKLGDDHPDTLAVMNNLGMTYNGLGRLEAAEPLLREVCDRVGKVLPEGDWRIGTCLFKYGVCLFGLKRYAEAEENLLEAYRISLSTFGPEARETIAHVYMITRTYETWDVVEPGQGHAEKAAEWWAKLPPAGSPGYPTSAGSELFKQGRYAEAEPLLRKRLESQEKVLPKDHYQVFETMSLLGEALAGQEKFAEAEPLLLEGYEKMDPPPYIAERKGQALERIINLYDAWDAAEPGKGYAEKAAEWRAKLPITQPTSGPSDRAGEEDGSEPPRP